jgi:hypothetical protein
MNLIDELNEELERARELLKVYESIHTGAFGAVVIRQTIKHAERSMQLGDTVEMLKAYGELKKLE